MSGTRPATLLYILPHSILLKPDAACQNAYVRDGRIGSKRLRLYRLGNVSVIVKFKNYLACVYPLPLYLKAIGILGLTVQNGTWVERAVLIMSAFFTYRNKWLKKEIRLLKWIYLEHETRRTGRLPITWCKCTAESLFNFNVSCPVLPLKTGLVWSLI